MANSSTLLFTRRLNHKDRNIINNDTSFTQFISSRISNEKKILHHVKSQQNPSADGNMEMTGKTERWEFLTLKQENLEQIDRNSKSNEV